MNSANVTIEIEVAKGRLQGWRETLEHRTEPDYVQFLTSKPYSVNYIKKRIAECQQRLDDLYELRTDLLRDAIVNSL